MGEQSKAKDSKKKSKAAAEAMQFGENNRHHKFYYGHKQENVVSQEGFWNQATSRELKINGAKKQGYGSNVDTQKLEQMRMFLHHRGASRGSSRHDAPIHTLPKLTQRTGQGMLTGRSRYSDVTRGSLTLSHQQIDLGDGVSVSRASGGHEGPTRG